MPGRSMQQALTARATAGFWQAQRAPMIYLRVWMWFPGHSTAKSVPAEHVQISALPLFCWNTHGNVHSCVAAQEAAWHRYCMRNW